MSMDVVDVVHRNVSRKVVTGYKVFRCELARRGRMHEVTVHFEYFPNWRQRVRGRMMKMQSVAIPRGTWLLKEKNLRIWASNRQYPSGFHVFANKEDAEKHFSLRSNTNESFTVLPVQCRGVLARGTRNDFGRDMEVLIAREIRVP